MLFLLVCLAWVVPGLVGHDPWKADDAVVFGLVFEMLRTGDPVVLQIAGEPFFERAPLYVWLAALCAKGFGGFLALHDAARLTSGLLMAGILACLSAASRELLGERAMRVAVLLFLGCIGLLLRAHEMASDLAGLLGVALALYGLALAMRRPRVGGLVAGLGAGAAFLGDGLLPLLMLAALVVVLPMAHSAWRTRAHAETLVAAVAAAAPIVALWPVLLWLRAPGWLSIWIEAASASRWQGATAAGMLADLGYFLRILPWYAWPAWPLAAWTLWRSRRMLATRKGIVLPLVAFVVFLTCLMLFADAREVNALPLLLPLAILGVGELDTVPRGGASALDWFGLTTFFLIATMIWAAWVTVMTGHPESMQAWIRAEAPGYVHRFRFLAFAFATLLTLVWLTVIARTMRSTRRALVNWTSGITMVWMLVMTLGLPIVDHARSYRSVATKLVEALPADFRCVAQRNLGDAQRALFDYFVALRTMRAEFPAADHCQVLLVQISGQRSIGAPPAGWREIWRGSRPGDRNEAFVLYQRT